MDERKLGELFRDAVPDAPPPSFDERSIVAESNRLRKRRKNALLGGSALGVTVLVVAGVVGVALWRGADSTTASTGAAPVVADSTGNGRAGSNEVPNEDAPQPAGGGASDRSFSAESPKQGGTSTGNAGPSGPGSTPSGCEKADPELAAALAGELRAAASAARPAGIGCPLVARGVALAATDQAGLTGVVSLVVVPANTVLGDPLSGQPDGSALRAASTSDGRRVILVSEPAAGASAAPFVSDLQDIADRLATKV